MAYAKQNPSGLASGIPMGAQKGNEAARFYSNNFSLLSPIRGAQTVATPEFSPVAGGYGPTQNVAITTSTVGASIYYTTDGSTPDVFSTLYSSPVAIASTTTLKAIGILANYNDSAVASGVYTINGQVATPTFSPVAGSYGSTQNVSISCATGGASIYYTLDGSTPTTGSTPYSGAISVSSSLTIKALAVKSGYTDSAIGSAAYVISAGAASAPTFGIAAGTYDRAMTQAITLSTSSGGASIYYTVDGSTPTTGSTLYTGAIPVDVTTTIKALASGGGYSDSSVSSATYTIISPQLYVTANGFDTGTSFADSSGYGKTVTSNGNAQTSTAQSVFGGSSGLFDGTGDSLSIGSSADLGLGTSDFVITIRVRATSWSGGMFLYDQRTADPSVFPCIYYAAGGYLGYHVNGSDRINGGALSTATWYNILLTRLSGTTKLYVDGAQVGSSYTDSNNYSAAAISLFARFNNTYGFNGHGSHVWIHKGTGLTDAEALAWYNANVAFAPHPNLLLHMDGTNGSTTFTDSSNSARTVNVSGNAQISTATPVFGTGNGLFDGSGDKLNLNGESAFAYGSADWTIEGWLRPDNLSAPYAFYDGRPGSSGAYLEWYMNTTGIMEMAYNSAVRIVSSAVLDTSAYTHVALVCKQGTVTMYMGGNSTGTPWAGNGVYLNGASAPGLFSETGGAYYFPCRADELQIIKGYAKYTANFTPPTRPFVA